MKYYIYTLDCPDTNEIRYVGKTANPKKRYYEHCYEKTKTYKNNWLKSLLKNNKKPLLSIIDEYDSEEECYKAEIYWIAQFKQWGFKLTNITDGGEGYTTNVHNIQGENSPKSKISNETAKKIIYDILENKLSLNKIAEKYSIPVTLVYNIKAKKTWKHFTKNVTFSSDYKLHKRFIKSRKGIPINQYDLNNNLVNSFNSVTEASKITGIRRSSIQLCISGRYKTAENFIWKKIN